MALEDLDPDGLYHLITADEWTGYQERGRIDRPSLDTEGFVHCSYGHQVVATVEKHFAGVSDLLALRLDPASLGGPDLVAEDSYGSGQTFPHVYGPIPAAAVLGSVPVT